MDYDATSKIVGGIGIAIVVGLPAYYFLGDKVKKFVNYLDPRITEEEKYIIRNLALYEVAQEGLPISGKEIMSVEGFSEYPSTLTDRGELALKRVKNHPILRRKFEREKRSAKEKLEDKLCSIEAK